MTDRSTPKDPDMGPDSRRGQPSGLARETYLFAMPWDIGDIGGVSQVVRALMVDLSQEGSMSPLLAVNSWEDATPRSVTDGGLRRVFLRVRAPFGNRGPSLREMLGYAVGLPRQIAGLRRFARHERVAVVNAHFPTPALLSWFLARSMGGPRYRIVLSLHGLEIRSVFDKRGLERRLWSWMLQRADRVIACSNGLRDEVTRAFDLPPGRVVTVHNGIDPAHIARARNTAPEAAPPMRPYLCNVGTFEPKKGHDVLLRAFHVVASERADLDLVLIGRAGETSASTRALIDELGLASRVRMIENLSHPETLSLMEAAEMFVLASRVESFAIVLLEAGALSQPVVATDICGVDELLEEGRTGVLVPSEDHERLARAILDLSSDPERRASLGKALHAHVAQDFSWRKAGQAYLDLAATSSPT